MQLAQRVIRALQERMVTLVRRVTLAQRVTLVQRVTPALLVRHHRQGSPRAVCVERMEQRCVLLACKALEAE